MNNEKNIFEVASRMRFRFPFKGMVSVEDLWVLPLKDLDLVFKTLNSELKQVQEESLLNTKTVQDEELDMKIEIIKHIVKVKQTEAELILKAREIKEQKQKILELIASKKDESIKSKSVEELEEMLNKLGN